MKEREMRKELNLLNQKKLHNALCPAEAARAKVLCVALDIIETQQLMHTFRRYDEIAKVLS